jgi:hypothetical protein
MLLPPPLSPRPPPQEIHLDRPSRPRKGVLATAANAGPRSVKAKAVGRFVRMRAKIVGNLIVRGGIVGDQIRNALRGGCELAD